MKRIYNGMGYVIGYEKDGYYLMKIDDYSWGINKTGQNHYFSREFSEAYDSGELIVVSSFKEGKKKIEELLKLA